MNLSAPTTGSAKDPRSLHLHNLDVLRGVAIMAVFLHHALGVAFGKHHLEWSGMFPDFKSSPLSFLVLAPFSYGDLGVAIFFVVSGFCIHLSHARSKDRSFKTFFIRRFFRIYPPYLVALLALALKSALSNHPASFGDFFSHLFLLHNLDRSFFFGINPSFWSIAIEVQLYLLYPLLWWRARNSGWKQILWATALIELSLRATSVVWPLVFPGSGLVWVAACPLSYWFSWSVGAALAEAFLHDKLPRVSLATCYSLAVAVLIAGLLRPLASFGFPLVALLTAGVIRSTIYSPANDNRFLRILARIGMVSYSLYLIHQPVLALIPYGLSRIGVSLHEPVMIFVIGCSSFALIYLLAALFYRWVELPSIEMGKKILARFRPKAAR